MTTQHNIPPGWTRGVPLRIYTGDKCLPHCACVRMDSDTFAQHKWITFKDPVLYNEWIRWWFEGVPVPMATQGTSYSWERATAANPVPGVGPFIMPKGAVPMDTPNSALANFVRSENNKTLPVPRPFPTAVVSSLWATGTPVVVSPFDKPKQPTPAVSPFNNPFGKA